MRETARQAASLDWPDGGSLKHRVDDVDILYIFCAYVWDIFIAALDPLTP